MKKLILLALIAISSSALMSYTNASQSEGIKFYDGNFESALALAKETNKPIFLDVSTSWCHYCKKMKTNTYPMDEVGSYFNKNFISVSVDAEKGEGPKLKKKYNVKGYPTLVFLNSEGELLKVIPGYKEPDVLINTAKKYAN